MRIAVVVGNPKANSRTLGVANAVAAAVEVILGAPAERLTVDLADFAPEMFDWASTSLGELTAQVASSDLVIFASPTYKATYTGLLKAFLDRYGNDGLAGTVAIPVMTGAAPLHALAPEVHLRPLLVELGASVPTRALYVTEDQLDRLDDTVGAWAVSARPVLARALA